MVGNIISHERPLAVKNAQVVQYVAQDTQGRPVNCATATGMVVDPLDGATFSANHSIRFDIALPFRPEEHALSLAPRGFELRGLARFGFRRFGWNLVDYVALPTDSGLTVDMTVWVNNKRAVSLGVLYSCTATAPVEDQTQS